MHQLQQIGTWIAFDVELDAPLQRPQVRSDVVDVSLRDVPRICTRVDGDARRARVDADLDRLEHRRNGSAARIAHGRNLVDVD
jgi:hypothetical protein